MDKQQREYIHHLMLQYSDTMVRLTYRRVGDWHLAEDLVQETFLTACCKSERVCGHKKPVAWLFETLNNLTLRESRRFYHTEVSIEDIAESYELTELPMACHIPMGLLYLSMSSASMISSVPFRCRNANSSSSLAVLLAPSVATKVLCISA